MSKNAWSAVVLAAALGWASHTAAQSKVKDEGTRKSMKVAVVNAEDVSDYAKTVEMSTVYLTVATQSRQDEHRER